MNNKYLHNIFVLRELTYTFTRRKLFSESTRNTYH